MRSKTLFFAAILLQFLITSPRSAQASGVDLQFTEVKLLTPQVYTDEWIKFRVTVQNSGSESSAPFTVDLYKNGQTSADLPVKGDIRHTIKELRPGATREIDFYFEAKRNSYQVIFVLDRNGALKETNETNNLYGPVSVSVQSGQAPDDSYEDNDVIASAKPLAPGEHNLVAMDDDYFTINATAGEYLDISARFDTGRSNIDLELIDSNGVIRSYSRGFLAEEKIFYLAEGQPGAAVSYTLHVSNSGGRNNYLLSLQSVNLTDLTVEIGTHKITKVEYPTQDQLDTIYAKYEKAGWTLSAVQKAEILRQLTRYYVDVDVQINANPSTVSSPFYVDLFRSSLQAPLPGTYGEDWLVIHPEDWNNPANTGEKLTSISRTMKIVVIPGTYHVYASADNDGNIREQNDENNVSAPVTMTFGDVTIADDSFEPNNTLPGKAIGAGVYNNLKALNDDYFSTVIPAGYAINISLDFVHSLGDLDLYLYDTQTGEILSRSLGSGNREYISYLNSTTSVKQVSIRVDEITQNLNYSLGVSFVKAHENDLRINQIAITPVTPSQGDTLQVRLYYENRGANDAFEARFDLFALPASGAPPVAGDTSLDYSTVIPVIKGREKGWIDFSFPLGTGEWSLYGIADTLNSIQETDESNNLLGPVTVMVGSGLADDKYEVSNGLQNDIVDGARVLAAGNYPGLLAHDDDWYKIDVPSGRTCQVSLYFNHASGDIDGFLYRPINSNGDLELVAEGVSVSDHEVFSYINPSSSTISLYVKVRPVNQSNSYTMSLQNITGDGTPDLVVRTLVSFPVTPVAGEIIRSTVAVENAGSSMTGDQSYIDFFHTDSAAPQPGQYGDMFHIIPSGLQPGETLYYNFDYQLTGGEYRLYGIADIDNTVAESVESNNAYGPRSLSVSGAPAQNLSVQNLTASLGAGGIDASLTITDSNFKSGAAFQVLFELFQPATGKSSERVIYKWSPLEYRLSLNQSGERVATWQLPVDEYFPAGDYQLRVYIDAAQDIPESNENDNIAISSKLTFTSDVPAYLIETYSPDGITGTDTVLEVYTYGGSPINGDPSGILPENLTLIRYTESANGIMSASHVSLPSGVYLVRIYGKGSSTGKYGLRLSDSSGTTALQFGEPSTTETTNSPSQALELNTGLYHIQYISSQLDEDWYFIEIP